ncbi:MAG: hypothetical protein ACP5I8_13560 [Phycisphaerae bacterium]
MTTTHSGRGWFTLALLACGVLLPEIIAQGQQKFASIRLPASLGVYYAGKPVRYRDLTLLDRRESEAGLDSVLAAYCSGPLETKRVMWRDYSLGPMGGKRYKPGARYGLRRTILGAYRTGLRGALYAFLREKVLATFFATYAPAATPYLRSRSVNAYLTAVAACEQRQGDLYASCALHAMTLKEFTAALRRKFPRVGATVAPQAFLSIQQAGLLYVLTDRCFPELRGARTAPWNAEETSLQESLMGRPMVSAFRPMERHLRRLIIRINGLSGSVLIMQCKANYAADVGKLISACLRRGTGLDPARFLKTQFVMRLLGSPTIILPGSGNYRYYSQNTGIPMSAIARRKLLPVKGQPGVFIYIYQKHPILSPRAEKVFFTRRPGYSLFSQGTAAIMMPIVKEVLRKTDIRSAFLRLPSTTEILPFPLEWAGGDASYLGTPLPPLAPPRQLILAAKP